MVGETFRIIVMATKGYSSALRRIALYLTAIALLFAILYHWDGLAPPQQSQIERSTHDHSSISNLNNTLLTPDQPLDSTLTSRTNVLDWYKLQRKGAVLRCYLDGTGAAPSTSWTSYSSLADWGWDLTRDDAQNYDFVAAKLVGVDVGTLENGIKMSWVHARATNHMYTDPKTGISSLQSFKPTNADFSNIFYPATGIILANSNYGPAYQIEAGLASQDPWPAASLVVKLRNWSDVTFLTWQSLTTPEQRAGLRWIFRRIIRNKETQNIIGMVAKKRGVGEVNKAKVGPGWKAPLWPGMLVRAGEQGFNVLLTGPNSKGAIWLLTQ